MADPNPLPSRKDLWELFDYEPSSGRFGYKDVRPRRLFASNAPWNRYHISYAGNEIIKAPTHRYCQVRIAYTKYSAHRIIWKMMTGEDPPQIDHINRNEADNRWCNLRSCTQSDNNGNRRTKKTHYGPKGTLLFKGRWRAGIAGRHLGTFETEQEAHEAYMRAAQQYFGEFAHDGT